MMFFGRLPGRSVALVLAVLFAAHRPTATVAEENPVAPWLDLSQGESLPQWQAERHGWTAVGGAALDPSNDRRLISSPGSGVLLSGGDGADLLTVEEFQDIEFACEFMIPKGSNSGVKFNALYELQIRDTHGQQNRNGDCCGGIYPRARLEPRYRLLDAGVPPRVNAALPAGEWQSLELRFYSPRFDASGKKLSPARMEQAVLNGELIHQRADLQHPTGHAWNTKPEVAQGPLLLQGDHGPVAFRNVRVRRIPTATGE